MAPKKNTSTASATAASKSAASSKLTGIGWVDQLWNGYWAETNHQTQIIDAFLAFLLLVGGLQALYFLVAGRNPYNAFLAGFIGTVGQFVLTVSLRMQTDKHNQAQFSKTSPERSFADYIFGSLILHFFCVNYIN